VQPWAPQVAVNEQHFAADLSHRDAEIAGNGRFAVGCTRAR